MADRAKKMREIVKKRKDLIKAKSKKAVEAKKIKNIFGLFY